jgi:hypothetical protein
MIDSFLWQVERALHAWEVGNADDVNPTPFSKDTWGTEARTSADINAIKDLSHSKWDAIVQAVLDLQRVNSQEAEATEPTPELAVSGRGVLQKCASG